MKFSELKLGKSVEITVVRNEYRLRLISKIEDTADDHISVTLIEGNGKRFVFLEEDQIQIVYKEQERLWRWTELKGVISTVDGTPVHSFYGKPTGESYNRRNAYRVYLGSENTFSHTKAEYGYLISEQADTNEKNEKGIVKDGCACIIKDLSENGAAILTNESLDQNDMVRFAMQTDLGEIHCIGKVVRGYSEREVTYANFYGIQFTEVSSVISKYIFAVQRMNLKKARQ